MKKVIVFSIVALALAAIMAGCCTSCKQKSKGAKPLACTEWHLVQFEGQEMAYADDMFNMTFGEDGRISGVGGCNRMMSSYTLGEKGTITIQPVATTMAYCPEADFEHTFTRALETVNGYSIEGDVLTLTSNGMAKAVFKALPAAQPATEQK